LVTQTAITIQTYVNGFETHAFYPLKEIDDLVRKIEGVDIGDKKGQ
jgi:hypothetical protein